MVDPDVDDFDDFQSGPSMQPAPAAAKPAAAAGGANANLFDLLNSSAPNSVPAQSVGHAARAPSLSAPLQPNFGGARQSSFSQQPMTSPPIMGGQQPIMASRPSYTTSTSTAGGTGGVVSPKPSGSTFDDLWTTSLSSVGGSNGVKPTGSGGPGKTIAEMEKEKAMNKLWGPTPGAASVGQAQGGQQQAKSSGGGAFDDLLM